MLVIWHSKERLPNTGAAHPDCRRFAPVVVVNSDENATPLLHELGHAFGLLDESPAPDAVSRTFEPRRNLVSRHLHPSDVSWEHLCKGKCVEHTSGTPSTTDDCVIAAWRGGLGSPTGYWRPAEDCCLMKMGCPDYCRVCAEWFKIRFQRAVACLGDDVLCVPVTGKELWASLMSSFELSSQSLPAFLSAWVSRAGLPAEIEINGIDVQVEFSDHPDLHVQLDLDAAGVAGPPTILRPWWRLRAPRLPSSPIAPSEVRITVRDAVAGDWWPAEAVVVRSVIPR